MDLLVVMDEDGEATRPSIRVKEVAYTPYVPMDVLVYTPAELERRLTLGDFFVQEIITNGRILYQRDPA